MTELRICISLLLISFVLSGTDGLGQVSFDVMSYNIRFDNPEDGPDQWTFRKERIVDQINQYDPAIFGIQEGMVHQVNYLDTLLPAFQYVGAGRDDGLQGGEFCAIFYQPGIFKLLETQTFWLSPTPEAPSRGWDAALNRVCTWARFEHIASKTTVWVFNTHYDHVGRLARQRSSILIMDMIRSLVSPGTAVILMGDFNATPGSGPITTITSMLDDAREHSEAAPKGPEGTFNGFQTDKTPGRRIDYIFVSGDDIGVRSFETILEVNDGHYPSDHFPVFATLWIK